MQYEHQYVISFYELSYNERTLEFLNILPKNSIKPYWRFVPYVRCNADYTPRSFVTKPFFQEAIFIMTCQGGNSAKVKIIEIPKNSRSCKYKDWCIVPNIRQKSKFLLTWILSKNSKNRLIWYSFAYLYNLYTVKPRFWNTSWSAANVFQNRGDLWSNNLGPQQK